MEPQQPRAQTAHRPAGAPDGSGGQFAPGQVAEPAAAAPLRAADPVRQPPRPADPKPLGAARLDHKALTAPALASTIVKDPAALGLDPAWAAEWVADANRLRDEMFETYDGEGVGSGWHLPASEAAWRWALKARTDNVHKASDAHPPGTVSWLAFVAKGAAEAAAAARKGFRFEIARIKARMLAAGPTDPALEPF